MKWLEEIHIRVYEGTREELMETLWLTLESHEPVAGLEMVHMYSHSNYESDFCLHLHWLDCRPDQGTDLGLQILTGLEPLASVKRTIWTESKTLKNHPNKGGRHEAK